MAHGKSSDWAMNTLAYRGSALSTLSVPAVTCGRVPAKRRSGLKITNVRLRELTGRVQHPDGPFWEERLIRPVDIYPEFHEQTARTSNWQPIEAGDTSSII